MITPYKGNEPYIFVSYAHCNSDIVFPILQRIQHDGYRVWFDEGIDPGMEWDENIADHITRSFFFIAFITGEYLESENCRDELSFARDINKNRLIIYLDNVDLPVGMKMRVNRLQAIHWYRYGKNVDTAYEKLYETHELDICRESADTPAPSGAAEYSNEDRFCEEAPVLMNAGANSEDKKALHLHEQNQGYRDTDTLIESRRRKNQKHSPKVFLIILAAAAVVFVSCFLIYYYQHQDREKMYAEQTQKTPELDTPAKELTEKGEAAFRTGDYERALIYLLPAAEMGNMDALFDLGNMYEDGKGVTQSIETAVEYYQKSAYQGNIGAQRHLGYWYMTGKNVSQSDETAATYFQMAADQGDAYSQWNLGRMYSYGYGVPQSYENAVKYYQLAADQGNSYAQLSLGVLYYYGRGVQQSYEMAAKYYKMAADQGYTAGQVYLGDLYFSGLGVAQSYEEAAKYYQMAADQGDTGGMDSLGAMYEKGQGVPKSYETALKYYRMAADKGWAASQYHLGRMYEYSLAVDYSITEALKYYQLAADQEYGEAVEKVKSLTALTPTPVPMNTPVPTDVQ